MKTSSISVGHLPIESSNTCERPMRNPVGSPIWQNASKGRMMSKTIQLSHLIRKASAAVLILLLGSTVALSQSLTFGVVGDTGKLNDDLRAIALQMSNYHTNKTQLEFVLLLGDNVYDDGIGQGLATHFEGPFKGLLDPGVKFYAVLGNHDIRKPEGIKLQTEYAHFNMGGRRFYSFTMVDGSVEFFGLDSTALSEEAEKLVDANLKRLRPIRDRSARTLTALRATRAPVSNAEKKLAAVDAKIVESEQFLQVMRAVKEDQLAWLDKALANSSAKWKIVFLHHAIFSSAYKRFPLKGHGKDKDVLRLRKLLHDRFVQHKVDVVFGGHDHVFEKTKVQVSPVTNHKITYITSGAGSKLRKRDLDRKNWFFEFGEDRKHSFLVVHLGSNKMEIDVVGKNGQNLFPRFSITKP